MKESPEVTFVFPCLNEAASLETCIDQVSQCLSEAGLDYEVLIADNGSTDGSQEIANLRGCRVVTISERGYGAALRAGIEASRAPYVMYADSDNTYLYEDAARLYELTVHEQADMAVASRLLGTIQPRAMPFLHRYFGTPILTGLINLLFDGRLSDCNSGFRCLKKSEYMAWGIRSSGMEFASELLIKSLKSRARIVELSSGLRCGPANRTAHLRTWRDGMRHLLFIFSEKPALFEWAGLICLALSSALQLSALLLGPVAIGPMNLLDLHSQAVFLVAGVIGAQLYIFGCSLFLRSSDKPLGLTRSMIQLDEGILFFCLAGTLGVCLALVTALGLYWAASGFQGLHQVRHLLGVAHFDLVSITCALGLLSIHTLKKAGAK